MSHLITIANDFGNVDVRSRVPKRYVHISGKRLQPLCRKLGIKYAEALTGFEESGGHWKPVTDGVVISARSTKKLNDAIEARAKRTLARPTRPKKKSRRQLQRERLEELGIDPDGRAAKWLTCGVIDEDQAQLIAFKAEFRHEHTNYDALLENGLERDLAREFAEPVSSPCDWSRYLAKYSFPHADVANVLAGVLADPVHAHPIWFCEAVIAIRRYDLDLNTLNYEIVRDAIQQWRDERNVD